MYLKYFGSWALFACCFLEIHSAAHINRQGAIDYLKHYGYYTQPDDTTQHDDTRAPPSQSTADDNVGRAIALFQQVAGIAETGQLDNDTLTMMEMPRCGVNDTTLTKRRHRRFILSGRKWGKTKLTYRIVNFHRNPQFSDELQRSEIKEAFKLWSSQSSLTFEETDGRGDIFLKFVRGNHGDNNPFDGPRGMLAHATDPPHGEVHFDDDESYTAFTPFGFDLRTVAAHEIGHALGLSHSRNTQAVMASRYNGYKANLSLHPDDINGIRALYGPPAPQTTPRTAITTPTTAQPTTRPTSAQPTTRPTTTQPTTRPTSTQPTTRPTTTQPTTRPTTTQPTTRPTTTQPTTRPTTIQPTTRPTTTQPTTRPTTTQPTTRPIEVSPEKTPKVKTMQDVCDDPRFQAAAVYRRSSWNTAAYAFRDDQVIRLTGAGAPRVEPILGSVFNEDGNGPNGDIDAAMYWPPSNIKRKSDGLIGEITASTYLFKGDSFWRYNGKGLMPGYPVKISSGFPGIPDELDGALFYPENGSPYFFKGDSVWRYDVDRRRVARGYPENISIVFPRIPTDLKGAFRLGSEFAYFFKGKSVYRLHTPSERVQVWPFSALLRCK